MRSLTVNQDTNIQAEVGILPSTAVLHKYFFNKIEPWKLLSGGWSTRNARSGQH